MTVIAPFLISCSAVSYYAQAVNGQVRLMNAAKPVDDWLADDATPEPLKQRLQLARQMRRFAAQQLALPDNPSYTAYADLKRPYVVWNVFATPELSLQLKSWCYPFFGCATYRGYFSKEAAERFATQLRAEGYDVNVGGVPAYSTLGWLNWLGGDPLLNTFIQWPEAELARLLFHELAHQVAYAKDDTAFNESFATAVEREGLKRWIAMRGDPQLSTAYQQYELHRTGFIALLVKYRGKLAAAFAQGSDAEKRARKRQLFAELQTEYQRLKTEQWNGWNGYDRFFAQDLNAAHLAAIGTYNDLVPAFEALLEQEGHDLPRFYAEVKKLAALNKTDRATMIRLLLPGVVLQ